MNGYSYASPKSRKITVNPLGEINGKTGEGVGGYGYSVASYNFDTSKGDLRDGKGFSAINAFLPYAAKRIYYYRRISGEDAVLDAVLVWCGDGYIYSLKLAGGTPVKLAALYFTKEPTAVNYNFNGEDVMIFSSENAELKIYDGTNVITVSSAPKVESMCVHGERLFLTDSSNHNSLWFSDDFDPTNWNVSLSEAGFIDMIGEKGRLLKVISFGGYIYVFRSYGITRVTAYGNQKSFSVADLFVSSGKIRGESITVCGDCVLFFASDGLYRFDGLSAARISDAYKESIDFSFGKVRGAYYNGRAYFVVKAVFEGESENCLFNVDPKNYSEYYFIKGGKPVDVTVAGGVNDYELLLVSGDGKILRLTDECATAGVPNTKIWLGKFGDFGFTAKRKLLSEISFYSATALQIEVSADGRTKVYGVKGKIERQIIRPNLTADRFSVKVKCTEKGARVVGLTLKLRYYDD